MLSVVVWNFRLKTEKNTSNHAGETFVGQNSFELVEKFLALANFVKVCADFTDAIEL